MAEPDEQWGTESWRGSVVAWQCDEMGHQNARFYAAQAMEGLAGHLIALGLASIEEIEITEHVVRFLRELRPGTPVHLQCASLECDDATALVAQSLHDSISGDRAATILTRVAYRATTPGAPAIWPGEFIDRTRRQAMSLPDGCGPRGLAPTAPTQRPTLARADALGLVTTGRGVITARECDSTGRLMTDEFTARFSDATRLYTTHFHRAVMSASADPRAVGSAGVETRQTYFSYPRVNDRFVMRTGLVAFDSKKRLVEYWMLDPVSGEAWARLESIELLLDLDTRKTFALSPEAQAALEPLLRPFWTGLRATMADRRPLVVQLVASTLCRRRTSLIR